MSISTRVTTTGKQSKGTNAKCRQKHHRQQGVHVAGTVETHDDPSRALYWDGISLGKWGPLFLVIVGLRSLRGTADRHGDSDRFKNSGSWLSVGSLTRSLNIKSSIRFFFADSTILHFDVVDHESYRLEY